ncbi:hypothetical protein KM043_010093 [Ampulex compressa]|nr:hypothetical protein KM043_010093 [Ampulex compressa]
MVRVLEESKPYIERLENMVRVLGQRHFPYACISGMDESAAILLRDGMLDLVVHIVIRKYGLRLRSGSNANGKQAAQLRRRLSLARSLISGMRLIGGPDGDRRGKSPTAAGIKRPRKLEQSSPTNFVPRLVALFRAPSDPNLRPALNCTEIPNADAEYEPNAILDFFS